MEGKSLGDSQEENSEGDCQSSNPIKKAEGSSNNTNKRDAELKETFIGKERRRRKERGEQKWPRKTPYLPRGACAVRLPINSRKEQIGQPAAKSRSFN